MVKWEWVVLGWVGKTMDARVWRGGWHAYNTNRVRRNNVVTDKSEERKRKMDFIRKAERKCNVPVREPGGKEDG